MHAEPTPKMPPDHKTLYIPITFGPNRLRGSSTGALIDDEDGGHLQRLRAFIRAHGAAPKLGRDVSNDDVTQVVTNLLKMCTSQHNKWLQGRASETEKTIGMAHEFNMPDGYTVIMASNAIISKITKPGVLLQPEETDGQLMGC